MSQSLSLKLNDFYKKATDSQIFDISCLNLPSFFHGKKPEFKLWLEAHSELLEIPVAIFDFSTEDVFEPQTKIFFKIPLIQIMLQCIVRFEMNEVQS